MQQSGKIILNYIPKSNVIGGIMSTIIDLMYSETDCDDYILIDNIFKPIRQYPDDITQDNILRCKPKLLLENIKKYTDNDEESIGIVINDFDLDMDQIKDDLFPLILNNNLCICINTFIEEELLEEKISIELLASNILDTTKEDWEKTKIEIEEEIKKSIEKYVQKDNSSKKEDIVDILKDLEGIFTKEEKDLFNIQQRHVYETDENILKIEITEDNDLILSDEDNSIFIDNDQVKHLLNTLKYFN